MWTTTKSAAVTQVTCIFALEFLLLDILGARQYYTRRDAQAGQMIV